MKRITLAIALLALAGTIALVNWSSVVRPPAADPIGANWSTDETPVAVNWHE